MLILASKSPRRIELLNMLNMPFKVIPATGEEIIEGTPPPFEIAEMLALKKAEEVFFNNPTDIILAADTIVVYENQIMGKPSNKSEARNMLTQLSGKIHKVYTGVALISQNKRISFTEETSVEFYPLQKAEIESYIDSNAPFDKAGGYGIQDNGALFIKRIDGDYYNVMGLPISRVYRCLSEFLNYSNKHSTEAVDLPPEQPVKIYKNPNCKKIRGSHVLEISCGYCKYFIARYQKVGETNLVKMYNDRIIEGTIDFSKYHGALFCPNCNERVATRYITKMDKKEAYRLVPSGFNKKKI